LTREIRHAWRPDLDRRGLRPHDPVGAPPPDGGEPETSVHDNLGTLTIVEALYRSDATGEAQPIEPEVED